MAPIGKVYAPTTTGNFRLAKLLVTKNLTGVDFETTPDFQIGDSKSESYLKEFPVGKVPAFVSGSFKLTDSTSILNYLISKSSNTTLVGANAEESALILQYLFFAEGEIMPAFFGFFYPTLGYIPYIKAAVQHTEDQLKRYLSALNTILLDKTYLVGERLTVADINMVCDLSIVFKLFADPAYRKEIRNVVRYFKTMIAKKGFKEVYAGFEFATEKAKVQQKPKEQAKPKKEQPKPKAQPKKEKKEAADEDEEAPAPKPKSALDLLPKSSFDLDAWKRCYSNNDTVPTAMDYFWQHFDPEGYSIWKVDFKYNEENTKVYMTNNLAGGFFARLERARKYAFGVLLTLGVDNDNMLTGYFVIRSDSIPFEVSDAADFESYSFVKVDHTDPKVRAEISDVFAWEGPSLPKPFADGKVFK